jgi:hypothetical protein
MARNQVLAPMYIMIPLRQCEVRGVKVLSISNFVQVGGHTRRFVWIATYHTPPSATPGHLSRPFEKGRATSYSLKLVVHLVILHRIMIQGVERCVDFGIVRMKKVLEHLPDDLNTLSNGKIGDPTCSSTYC